MRHSIRYTHLCILSIFVAGCGLGPELAKKTHPDPVRMFREREVELRDYVRRINTEQLLIADDQGYEIPQFLVDAGAKEVKKKDVCLIIVFNFLPTDAVQELWYCERGFGPLPAGLAERKRQAFYQWELLTPDWGFCKWDQ